MVVLYTIPSSKYTVTPAPDATLDEIEIIDPPPTVQQNANNNATSEAEFKVNVKLAPLTNAKATIIVTRHQTGLNGPAVTPEIPYPPYPTWNQTQPTDFESLWTTGQTLGLNASPTFRIGFPIGPAGSTYRLTYRLEADQYREPVETTFDMTVVA